MNDIKKKTSSRVLRWHAFISSLIELISSPPSCGRQRVNWVSPSEHQAIGRPKRAWKRTNKQTNKKQCWANDIGLEIEKIRLFGKWTRKWIKCNEHSNHVPTFWLPISSSTRFAEMKWEWAAHTRAKANKWINKSRVVRINNDELVNQVVAFLVVEKCRQKKRQRRIESSRVWVGIFHAGWRLKNDEMSNFDLSAKCKLNCANWTLKMDAIVKHFRYFTLKERRFCLIFDSSAQAEFGPIQVHRVGRFVMNRNDGEWSEEQGLDGTQRPAS